MYENNFITIKSGILRQLRDDADKNQQDIADFLGLSRGAYQHLEAKGILSAEQLVNLSVYYKVPVYTFFEISTLSQADFSVFGTAMLSDEQKKALELFDSLTPAQRVRALGYLEGLSISEI